MVQEAVAGLLDDLVDDLGTQELDPLLVAADAPQPVLQPDERIDDRVVHGSPAGPTRTEGASIRLYKALKPVGVLRSAVDEIVCQPHKAV